MSNFLSNLPKTTIKSKRRVGRGYGSQKGGHTIGHGQKGQKSRGKMPLLFAGTKNKKSIVQRLPILRGKNKFKALEAKPLLITLTDLNTLVKNAEVTIDSLAQAGVVKLKVARLRGVKLLKNGKLNHPLTIKIPVSAGAKAAVETAGGKVV